MSDQIQVSETGELQIDSIIRALEATPDRAEILAALEAIRADRVKSAIGQTVQAATFDRARVFADFLADNGKAPATVRTYNRQVNRLFAFLDRRNVHVLALDRQTVMKFRAELVETASANTARVCLAACAAFFSYLVAIDLLTRSPFAGVKYPAREYKKSIRPDAHRPSPIPTPDEVAAILDALATRATIEGRTIAAKRARESANMVYAAVSIVSEAGLRVGALPSLRLDETGRATYTTKGRKKGRTQLAPDAFRKFGAAPFASVSIGGIANAIKRVTTELANAGTIRHAYSAHDFRHHFATARYKTSRDIVALSRALDHASIATTQIYLASIGLDDITPEA